LAEKQLIKMKNIFLFCLFFFFIAFSCKEISSSSDCENPDYSDCNTNKPVSGQLNIKLTINSENSSVPLVIYTGKIEDNNLYDTVTVTSGSYSTSVDIDHFYSVTATYKSGNKTIIAVDGDDVKSKSNTNCDSTCYSVQDGSIDVRLKY
jgi:hypothetical protein